MQQAGFTGLEIAPTRIFPEMPYENPVSYTHLVYLHCIMDGRDTDPHSGKGFLADLQAKLDELGIGKIASVSGRYYAMDRDNNWDREEKAYAAFVYGEGNHAANAAEAIEASYAADVTDEFVVPVVTCEGGRVQDGDTVIFMNFRPDRARQMTRIFCDDAFTGFERRGGRKQVNYVCMAEYEATMPNCEVADVYKRQAHARGFQRHRNDSALGKVLDGNAQGQRQRTHRRDRRTAR